MAVTPTQLETTERAQRREAPLYVPADWQPTGKPGRDVALDALRGLAMVILIVNHLHLESPLEVATSALVSAAEVLVAIAGVVSGMVFGRRWRTSGARATTLQLLRRARKLYLASLVVVVLVGLFTLLPGAATGALTRTRGRDTYDFDGVLDGAWSILVLDAGPWQFNILAFFVVLIALTPLLLWALDRGWSLWLAAGSVAVYLGARAWDVHVLPSQSEHPFPLLVWQVLFVGGLLVGWHRPRLEALGSRVRRGIAGATVALGLFGAYWLLAGPGSEAAWSARHFDKDTLDPLRILAMTAFGGTLYLLLRSAPRAAERLLLPLGRNSFYVFIVQVFVCLALASLPVLGGEALGPLGNVAVQAAAVAGLWLMVTRRVLFRWIPR